MHSPQEDLDRYCDHSIKQSRSPSMAIPIPPHGMLYSKSSSVYTIDGIPVENNPPPILESNSAVTKSVKIAFMLILIIVLFTGFVFAVLSVTKLSKRF